MLHGDQVEVERRGEVGYTFAYFGVDQSIIVQGFQRVLYRREGVVVIDNNVIQADNAT